jgi:hypothetical protein
VVLPAAIPDTLLIWNVNDLLLQWDMDLRHHKDHHHTSRPTEARIRRTLLIYPTAQHRSMVFILLVVQHQEAILELRIHHTHHNILLLTVVLQDMVVVVLLLPVIILLLCIRLLRVMVGDTKAIITPVTAVLLPPTAIIHRSIHKARQRIEDRLQSLLHLLLQPVLILVITKEQIIMIRSPQNNILLR